MGDLVIVKFGGSTLRNGYDYLKAAKRVKELVDEGRRVVVVVSAMKGITDLLLSFDKLSIDDVISVVKSMHIEALNTISSPSSPRYAEALRYIEALIDDLVKTLWAVKVLGEASPRVIDYIVSFGERLSIALMSLALEAMELRSKWLTGREAGIVTDSSFGDAKPIHEISRELVRETLLPLLEDDIVPVVAGFIAGTIEGTTTVLGRGGSDYTATLIAMYLGANEVRLYTDVPGIMSADPKRIDSARVIPLMSFEEAIELAYLGAKKFHPRTFEPLQNSDTVVKVLSVEGMEGTAIDRYGGGPPLKAVTVLEDLALVSIIGTGMVGRLGTAAEVMSVFAKSGANIVAIVQPVSEVSISVVVERRCVPRVVPKLKKLVNRGIARDIIVVEPIAAVSVVGHGVREQDTLKYVVDRALSWPTKIVSWTTSSVSVSFAVPQENVWVFAKKLHDEVVLRWWIS